VEINQLPLKKCHEATGTVVVIDVLRAFTTSAFAFAAGAEEIILVSTVEEAFELKAAIPEVLLMGEVKGLPVAGFDFGNSPAAIKEQHLRGRRMILRTSAGTQGVVRSEKAGTLLASSLVCAGATANYIQKLAPEEVTFVITGSHAEDGGKEDKACADYISTMLLGNEVNRATFVQRVRGSAAGRKFLDPTEVKFPIEDLECACDVDRFGYPMVVERRCDLLVLKSVPVLEE
jgi:2-phosphosulfolactate phosphatase